LNIDIHAHALPQDTLLALRAASAQFPGVDLNEADDKFRLCFAGGKPTRPVMPGLRLIQPRLDFLSERNIQLQLVGGWLDGFGYELGAEEGADWSRFQNEHLQSVCAGNASLRALATVPLQSGLHAATVLREAAASGMPGAMIGTQPHGSHGNLDAEHLDDFWAAAEELGMPIIVHPMFGSADARLADFQMMNAVGRVTDITIAIARMLFSGHLLRFPKLKLIASTGGGALPYTLGRLMRNRDAFPNQVADPHEGFAKLYFDSIVFEVSTLEFLVEKVGAERIMLGSDYPFPIGDPRPLDVIKQGRFSDEQKTAMLGGVARQIFGL
jgi:aminocarboxymuconate-semialdehyde decarboxylase